jgi:hypothetical protein
MVEYNTNVQWEMELWKSILKRQMDKEKEWLKALAGSFILVVLFSLLVTVSWGQGIRTSESAVTALEEANLHVNSLGVGCDADGVAGNACYKGCLKRGNVAGYAQTYSGDADTGWYDHGNKTMSFRADGNDRLFLTEYAVGISSELQTVITKPYSTTGNVLEQWRASGKNWTVRNHSSVQKASISTNASNDTYFILYSPSHTCYTYLVESNGRYTISKPTHLLEGLILGNGKYISGSSGNAFSIQSTGHTTFVQYPAMGGVYDLNRNTIATFSSGFVRFKEQIFGYRIELDEADGAAGCQINVGTASSSNSANVAIYGGGSDNKPGMLLLEDDAGGWGVLWMDTAGNLRGSNAIPTDDDTDGVIIADLSP